MPKDPAIPAQQRRYSEGSLEEAARKRSQHSEIRRYLNALEGHRRPVLNDADRETLEERLASVLSRLADASSMQRVSLVQERLDLESRLNAGGSSDDAEFEDLETAFVDQVADWAGRKGISYEALREVGVPARVLARAGMARTVNAR